MNPLSGRILALAAFLALPIAATAESSLATAPTLGTKLTTAARLDFQVTIPPMLYLQVGADPTIATSADASIAKIDFNVDSGQVGNGSIIDATLASGNRGRGIVTARVTANVGPIELRSETTGALQSSDPNSTETISWSQISTVSNTPTGGVLPQLAHPTLGDGTATTLQLSPLSGKVIQQEAEWTYKYLNGVVVAAGTYGDTSGGGTRNARVIYTASMP